MTTWSMLLSSKHSHCFKVKNVCFTKMDKFRKTSAISSIFIKTTFLARMRCLKYRWPLSLLPRAYFCHPQLLKKKFGESCHLTAFTKKHFLRIFDENWRHTILIRTQRVILTPHRVGLTRCIVFLRKQNWSLMRNNDFQLLIIYLDMDHKQWFMT